jgi:hypothetical protein
MDGLFYGLENPLLILIYGFDELCMYIHLLVSQYIFILHKQTVQPLVRIILPTFNKLSYLQIILRIMKKKTSVILTATIATVLTLAIVAVAAPTPVLAGTPGGAGVPGHPGQPGVGSDGGSANGGLGGNADDGAAS